MKRTLTVAVALVLLVGAGAATAFILEPGVTKNAGKWRDDQQKQSIKYSDSIVKAVLKCEKAVAKAGFGTVGLECFSICDTGDPDGGPTNTCFDVLGGIEGLACTDDSDCAAVPSARCLPDPRPCAPEATAATDLAAAMDAAASSFDPGKKAFDADGDDAVGDLDDFRSIGCIADCSPADGTQLDAASCGANPLVAWQAAVTAPDGAVRKTLSLFDLQFTTICGNVDFDGDSDIDNDDANDCTNDQGKALAKLISCVNKAIQKCESKTGAGTDDGSICDATQADVAACESAALASVIDAGDFLVPLMVDGVVSAVGGVYNRQVNFDSGGSPGVVGPGAPLCGSCGDGVLNFGEECDPGGADAACPGSCPSASNFVSGQTACQCP